ncbi:hypothetical protein JAAARDRAFT_241032 [Jaapia argillacea MUCL 33604]|uniref:Arginyl-tRNA--protein transferase 1 n=1 Tax=Jaapia argillacea MUCL 33604 TaxID=933084 RepID=A0A067QQE0_9AGAM|nr:hypothetical protein JAAARDRAFT_241032 [Jaapia argillacea MUCL 33604]
MTNIISIVTPSGSGKSTCGYCGPPGGRSATKSSFKTSLTPSQLSCEVYQKMIDRGWRRSGSYCYKPDLKRSCCPQYTIKLDALDFKPSKSQRKLINRWNRFVFHGDGNDSSMDVDGKPKPKEGKGKKSDSKGHHPFSLIDAIHESEARFATGEPVHQFEVTLEPSSYTEEKFALFTNYQESIHHDDDNEPSGFKRFLVDSPLYRERIPYPSTPPSHLPDNYGAYHQLYRLDGELIAMGVVDILPGCVSSVYFMYDKRWEKFSLGRLSALREVSLALELHQAGASDLRSLYMGFYIYSCPKMRYKGDYAPSYLADPEDYTWHPLETCVPLLEKYRYACFSHPEHSLEGAPRDVSYRVSDVASADLRDIRLITNIRNGIIHVTPINASTNWYYNRPVVLSVVDALGLTLAKEVLWYIQEDGFDDDEYE